MKVEARLTYGQIRHDQPKDAHLVLSLTAPPLAEETKRPPICVVAAIDVSPSMEGPKLAYAKQSAIKMVDHLQPGDYFGLVDFAQSARLVIKPQKVTTAYKDEAKRQIGGLKVRGATNIADALLVSLDAANRMDLGAEVITRCILFTDGDANTGVAITPKAIIELLSKNLGIATVSAFGYGEDVKQELLADIAKVGKANYAFVKNPDDALSAFGKELGGLVSTWATGITVELAPSADEHSFRAIVSDVEAEEDVAGHMTIKIPDLLAEETRHIVLGVNLAPQKAVGPRAVNVFEAKIAYDVIGTDGRKERKTIEAKAKVQFVKAGDEQKTPTKTVDEIVAQAQIVRAQIEAEQAAQQGDFKTAGAVFQKTSKSLQDRGHADLGSVVSHLHGMYADSNSYRTTSGNRVGMRTAMTRAVGASGLDRDDEALLSSARYNMSNSSQTSMVSSFTGDTPPPPAIHGGTALAPVATLIAAPSWVGGVAPAQPSAGWVQPAGGVSIQDLQNAMGVVPFNGMPPHRPGYTVPRSADAQQLQEAAAEALRRIDADKKAKEEKPAPSSKGRKPLKQTKSPTRW
jgi:Ca-activated chloride channel family protein